MDILGPGTKRGISVPARQKKGSGPGCSERLARLERTAESHGRCTPTELANWNKVSRQTVYNWRDRGLLVYDGRRINVPGTVALWKFLIKLR